MAHIKPMWQNFEGQPYDADKSCKRCAKYHTCKLAVDTTYFYCGGFQAEG